jgi:vanillate monooxygenase ferredoxin subunit
VLDTARARGWPEAQLHWEHFGAPPAAAHAAPPAEGVDADGPFDVVLASTGQRITVQAGQSAAEALEAAGVALRVSCGAGVCGACRTNVLQGQPDHRDHCLTAEEQAGGQVFTPCCSRSLSAELVLDL